MVRLQILLLVLMLYRFSTVNAQITPMSYFATEFAVKNDPNNESKIELLKSYRKEIESLFRNLPPLEVIAFETSKIEDGNELNQVEWDNLNRAEWENRIKKDILHAGVKVRTVAEGDGPRLIAHVFQNRETKRWGNSLELIEAVILVRPDSPVISVSTYVDKSSDLATKQEAERRLFESLERFCWLYKKFSN